MKPFEGAKEGGLKGFGKGMWQGISGLVKNSIIYF